jgi:hypothetical protein
VATSGQTLTNSGVYTAATGTASFSDLALTGTIGSYVLTFSSTGLNDATVSVALSPGAADHLTISASSSAANATALATQPLVTIYDASNNVVTGSNTLVTLSATGATIGGTYTMNAASGVANFSGNGVKLTGSIGLKTLTASINSGAISVSRSVQLTVGSATQLAITTAADGARSRQAFDIQPVIEIQDVSGNLLAAETTAIDVTVSAGPTLDGTASVAAVNGQATFTNLGLHGTVGTFTLTYTLQGTSVGHDLACDFGE